MTAPVHSEIQLSQRVRSRGASPPMYKALYAPFPPRTILRRWLLKAHVTLRSFWVRGKALMALGVETKDGQNRSDLAAHFMWLKFDSYPTVRLPAPIFSLEKPLRPKCL